MFWHNLRVVMKKYSGFCGYFKFYFFLHLVSFRPDMMLILTLKWKKNQRVFVLLRVLYFVMFCNLICAIYQMTYLFSIQNNKYKNNIKSSISIKSFYWKLTSHSLQTLQCLPLKFRLNILWS